MKTYHISARRWFDRRAGNTYHSVTIYSDGEIVAASGLTYGYGDHWEQTAAELLEALPGIKPRRQYENGGSEPLRLWAERTGLVYSTECLDVPRKKDIE